MTYHPIDKPTEPGWYWAYSIHSLEFRAIEVYKYDGVLKVDTCKTLAQYSGQFYGPSILPPTPSEVNVSKSDVPRRFRWRERIKARGLPRKVTGVGVCWLREGEFLYECWPGETSSVVPSQVEITEWLDPEPEKPDAWQTLFDCMAKERAVTKDEVAAAISVLREKVPLD